MARELLTIELIPRTSWFRNVRASIPRAEWDRVRQIVYRRASHVCEICGGRGERWPVECHEVFAYNDALRTQTLVRLLALCPACHEVKHLGLAEMRGQREAALAHLARVNGWSRADAELYAEGSFELWHQRSGHQWSLDLSYLEQFGLHVPTTKHGATTNAPADMR